MSIKPTRLISGSLGYQVIDMETKKAIYTSESKVDCEQVMYALKKARANTKIRKENV